MGCAAASVMYGVLVFFHFSWPLCNYVEKKKLLLKCGMTAWLDRTVNFFSVVFSVLVVAIHLNERYIYY